MSTKPKHKPNTQRRVVAYVRISRAREDESSTKTQEAAIRAYCAVHGWFLVDVIVEPGRSAFKTSRSNRPGFKKAMALIAGGAADTFVVWKLDRAFRNTLDLLTFIREDMAKHGAEFVSVTESFDTTTPMGRAMMTIVSALAELESAQKAERALEWHAGRRLDRRVPTGPPSLGYRRELDDDGNAIPNTLEVDPVVGPLVREAAVRVLAGDSLAAIVRWLNDSGVTITRPGLVVALQSPTAAGLVSTVDDEIPEVEGDWTPLLDRETWNTLRLILNDPGRRTNTTNVLQHPLRPLVRCHCGGAMKVQGDNRQYHATRYVCTQCLNGITQQPVDEAVETAVLAHLDDSAWRSLRASGTTAGPDPTQIDADLKAMWKMVLDRTLDMDEYVEAKARWTGELMAATSPLAELPDVESVREAWAGLDPRQKHLVYRRTITSLVIGPATRRGRGVDLDRIALDI